MNVLVVGGAGYIGSATIVQLLKAGHKVVAFDNLSHGHPEAIPAGVPLVVGDIGDADALDGLFKRYPIDVVMHFAALIEAGESMKAPEQFFRNNTASTLTLLEAMLRHNVKRLVFSSTAALFGNPDRVPVAEDAPLQPTNAYGESKLLVERMLDWLNRIHGLRFVCLRYFNAAGAISPDRGEDHQPESHLVPLILKVALGQRDSISVFGTDYPTPDGTCVRDYIHVADLAQAHLLALDALSEHDRLHFNLGNGAGFSVREVVEAARKVTGHPIPCIEGPRRPGDPAILVAASQKIRNELGWQPRYTSLEEIIRSAWEWHRGHPNGYASAK
ncbi:UDP-glucose 4-epimerase GalE [Telmatospirillum sp.]|uniref:UDP-glucose 4-epimerase GalE n=1 Tax=Telmatospirillum sp. TaxID=2079197 RepID=UPI00283C6068|nr:UDP-glucose 4-epimerase GalE [Telmatospirillum sp.]MDR3438259.1 UDP-glucose 4-epimerase GalE [Telmatospirillum sp.]